MSILEKITSILDTIEEMNGKLDRLLARPFKLVEKEEKPKKNIMLHSPGFKDYKPEPKKENTNTEEVEQDLTQVLLFNETEKAFLVVKHGFQVWVAKSHLEDSAGYDLGNTYDLKVKEKSKWVLKKLDWKPFEVFKD